ncbi:MAG: type III pantothenate kinase, partial [Clostridiales bacterium]|nr:type III pantothenate kinase [Clostridiales bacterium]
MNLGVSIGNTNTRCAIGTKEYNRQVLIPTDKICSPNDFINFLEGQFQEDIWGLIDGSIISSVVPAKTPAIMSALGEKLNTPPKLINLSELNVDFSGYKSKIGDDRAVCCSAAAIKYPLPIILIDLGTATTINVVDSGGVFLGGAILAGIQTGLLALTNHTAQLNLIDNFSNIKIIGTDTQKSLASGAIIGAACI